MLIVEKGIWELFFLKKKKSHDCYYLSTNFFLRVASLMDLASLSWRYEGRMYSDILPYGPFLFRLDSSLAIRRIKSMKKLFNQV